MGQRNLQRYERYRDYDFPRCLSRCPVCGGTSIEGENIDFEYNAILHSCSCSECGAYWADVYEYSRFSYKGVD